MVKKTMRRIAAMVLAVILVFGLAACEGKETESADPVERLIDAYAKGQGQETIDDILKEIGEKDEALEEAWKDILTFWNYADNEMEIPTKEVPEGLPEDDSVAIVVFGHVLNDDGSMQDELIGRLELGLALAEKYPNAYLVSSGGGTAKKNKDVTEGGLMSEWYLEHGVDPSRVITEDKAPNTVGNAENTYKILKEQYPQVDSWIIVSSDHHVPRCSILSYATCRLKAYESGEEPMKIIANMGYASDYDGYESMDLTATGVADVAKVNYEK